MLFGAHVSSAGGIDAAIDRIEKIGGDCVQVFTQSPRMWRPTDHKPEAIERFKKRRAEAGIGGVVCHALYLCNLATLNDEIYDKSVATIKLSRKCPSGRTSCLTKSNSGYAGSGIACSKTGCIAG